MNDDTFDNFLQDACMELHARWTGVGGRELTSEELQELNTKLTEFFEGKP